MGIKENIPFFSTFFHIYRLLQRLHSCAMRHIKTGDIEEGREMRKTISKLLFTVFTIHLLAFSAFAVEYLVPGGQVIGLELRDNTVTIAAFDDALGAEAKSAGLKIGDRIISIDDKQIRAAEDIRKALTHSKGSVDLLVERSGKNHQIHLNPCITSDGPRLGVYLRQGITGIGTITWYNPSTHAFGTLGHGVNGSDGNLLPMVKGNAYPAQIAGVKMGKSGNPGQLKGILTNDRLLGTLEKNTVQGVFGTLDVPFDGKPIPVAEYDDVHPGEAKIRSTVTNKGIQEYSVEILKIYPRSRSDCRNLVLKITDPELLDITGGIVQGMSGSPIIQDGKLVGAVTHVLVNDPTMGYGIFIENMLDAAA